jgi:hypothetical protein
MLLGRVDRIFNGKICGWAFNSDTPAEHLVIRVMRGSKVIASGVANILRPDLPEAGVGDGDHSFQIPLPTEITKMDGLMLIAQSARDGEIALPIANDDDRRIDQLFTMFSSQYEEALIALKGELDSVKERCDDFDNAPAATSTALPADLSQRLVKLETRMEEAEVFFVRIDEMVRRLAEAQGKKTRKRFLGIF